MAYWKEWKSLIGGGVGFIVLGVIMFVLTMIEESRNSDGGSSVSSQFNWYGFLFLMTGIAMLILGYLLRKKPGIQ